MKTLSEKIDLILREEKRNYDTTDCLRQGILGSFNIAKGDGWALHRQERVLILDPPTNKLLFSKKADLLLKLYSSLDSTQKTEFQNLLLSHLSVTSEFVIIAYLPFFVLHRTGKIVEAIKKVKTEIRENNIGYNNALEMLSKILNYEWNVIPETGLDDIKEIFKGTNIYSILDRINSIEIKLLEYELQEVNQEVNEDKETLVKEFDRFGFPKDLTETLNKIDQKLKSATDDFDFKSCMDLIRSFTERFYESIASSLGNGEKIDGKDSEQVAKFFQKHDLISEEQGKILTSLRHFLSNWGSHRLKSKSEDARLSKNMAIEFSLYITRRLEEVKG